MPFLVPRRRGRGRGGVGGRSETIRKSLSSELDGIKARSGEVDWPVRERSPSALPGDRRIHEGIKWPTSQNPRQSHSIPLALFGRYVFNPQVDPIQGGIE